MPRRRYAPAVEPLDARALTAVCNPMILFMHPGELLPPPIPPDIPPIVGIPLPPQSLFLHHSIGLSPVLPTDPIP
jgi:hypothetical protein